MSDDELIPRNFQLAREASMTTANLLRSLLIPIIVFLGVISLTFGWRSRFLGAHVYPFASGLSILVASLLVWMAWLLMIFSKAG